MTTRRLTTGQPKRVKLPRQPSELEAIMTYQIRVAGLPTPIPELRFHPTRQWRLDLAFPQAMVALEVEGGTHTGRSRHTSVTGFEEDCVKYAEAQLLGWTVLRVTSKQVRSGQALAWLERLLAMRTPPGVAGLPPHP